MAEKTIKILISYHKDFPIISDSIMTPIFVGKALSVNGSSAALSGMLGDDTGDNISRKNPTYNEMTAVYWAWKNYSELGAPDYIGFMHYRRHFIFEEQKNAVYRTESVKENHLELIKYQPEKLINMLQNNDFIVAAPCLRKSVYSQYKLMHDISDLDAAIKILKSAYPEYAESCDKYLSGSDAYFFNMFIFSREIFMDYAEWIFTILNEYEKIAGNAGKRLFISERLTGIYVLHLIDSGLKALRLPTIYIEGDTSLKARVNNAKYTYKSNRTRGVGGVKSLLYACKCLLKGGRRGENKRI